MYLEILIPLTFIEIDTVLIFYIKKCLESQFLLTRVTLKPVLKQAVDLGLESGSKCLRVNVIAIIAYVQPLNIKPKPKNRYIVLEPMTRIDEMA